MPADPTTAPAHARLVPAPGVLEVLDAAATTALTSNLTGTKARVRAAESDLLTGTVAERLARSKQPQVRAAVAGNPATPPHLLAALAGDHDAWVSGTALNNPTCPYPVVAAHPHADPVDHPDAPVDVVVAAAAGPRYRQAFAHRHLPEAERAHAIDTIAAGLADPDTRSTRVTDATFLLANPSLTHPEAVRILDLTTPVSRSIGPWTWAVHPHADPAWLAAQVEDTFTSAQEGTVARAAGNPATPADVLTRIATGHRRGPEALANPTCPSATIVAVLTAHGLPTASDPRARWAAARAVANPAAGLEVLDHIPTTFLHRTDAHRIVAAWATSAAHAELLLHALTSAWPGTVGNLIVATQAAVAAVD